MSHQEPKANTILKYWPLIAVSIGIIASYVTLQNQHSNAETRITNVEGQQKQMNTDNTRILTELSAIRTDLLWIKSSLSK